MFEPSSYQQAIFDWIRTGQGDGVVNACAGSGKTTTLVEGAKLLNGRRSLFCAFNRHIADALRQRLAGTGMIAMTIHGIGMQTLGRHLSHEPKIEDRKYFRIVKTYVSQYSGEFRANPEATSQLHKVCRFVRLTLTNYHDQVEMSTMVERYNLDWQPNFAPAVKSIIEHGNRLAEDTGEIDFNDMLWLPHVLNLQPRQFGFIFVDECQDLSRAQLDLVLKSRAPGGRSLFVGDPNQSVQFFAGADCQSYFMIRDGLEALELPLSICYRCPRDIIAMAKEIVPQIEAAPGKQRGTIISRYEEDDEDFLTRTVREKDLIMCRRNGPLLKHCLRLIRNGVQARVRGRDVGRELADLARRIGATCDFGRFPSAVIQYEQAQRALLTARDASDDQLEMLSDKCQAIQECYEGFRSPNAEAMAKKIEDIFADSGAAIWFSSIHRAKGLEAPRTWILDYDRLGKAYDGANEEEKQQELNLRYVALTRSQDTMYLISKERPKPKPDYRERERTGHFHT